MAKLTIEITAPKAQFETLAEELGYQEFIVLNVDGEATPTPNSMTKEEYLRSVLKSTVVNELTRVKVKAIDNEIRDERETDKANIRTAIQNATNVTFGA